MEVQRLSRKARVKSLMIFHVAMLYVVFVLLQDRYFSKVALWRKAYSREGDDGLTRAMVVQMISRRALVRSLMVFYVSMCFVVLILLQDRYFSKGAPCQT